MILVSRTWPTRTFRIGICSQIRIRDRSVLLTAVSALIECGTLDPALELCELRARWQAGQHGAAPGPDYFSGGGPYEHAAAMDVEAVPAGLQGVTASMPRGKYVAKRSAGDTTTEPFVQLGQYKEVCAG